MISNKENTYKILLIILFVIVLMLVGYVVYSNLSTDDKKIDDNKSSEKADSESSSSSKKIKQILNQSELWDKLLGYWTVDNTEFIVFGKEGSEFTLGSGIWFAGGGRLPGKVTNLLYEGQDRYTVTVFYEAEEGNDMQSPYEETTSSITIDVKDIENKKITLTSRFYSEGDVNLTYVFSGKTSQEAINSLEE